MRIVLGVPVVGEIAENSLDEAILAGRVCQRIGTAQVPGELSADDSKASPVLGGKASMAVTSERVASNPKASSQSRMAAGAIACRNSMARARNLWRTGIIT